MRRARLPILLAGALLAAGAAPAADAERYETLGALATRVFALAGPCGYAIDEGAYVAWLRARIPPEARPAFLEGGRRAGDEIMQIAGQDVLESWADIDAGRAPQPPGLTGLRRSCPDLQAVADALGWLAEP